MKIFTVLRISGIHLNLANILMRSVQHRQSLQPPENLMDGLGPSIQGVVILERYTHRQSLDEMRTWRLERWLTVQEARPPENEAIQEVQQSAKDLSWLSWPAVISTKRFCAEDREVDVEIKGILRSEREVQICPRWGVHIASGANVELSANAAILVLLQDEVKDFGANLAVHEEEVYWLPFVVLGPEVELSVLSWRWYYT